MHAVALHAIRTACRPVSRRTCRFIGGSRHPAPRRQFHRSALLFEAPHGPPVAGDGKDGKSRDTPQPELDEANARNEDAATSSISTSEIVDIAPLSQRVKNGKSGSARGRRQKQLEGLPPVVLPDWFWKNNVKCIGDPDLGGTLAVYGERGIKSEEGDKIAMDDEMARQSLEVSECELSPTESARYSIHVDIYKEILVTLRAALTLRPPKSTTAGSSASSSLVRPITHLQCPKDGGTYYLDSVVETIASKLDADLIRIDAQDIAQIVGPYMDENLAWGISKTSLWGYNAEEIAGNLEEYAKEPEAEEEDVEAGEEEDSNNSPNNPPMSLSGLFKKLEGASSRSNRGSRQPQAFMNSRIWRGAHQISSIPSVTSMYLDNNFSASSTQKSTSNSISSDQWSDLKVTALLDAITDAAEGKRAFNNSEVLDGKKLDLIPRKVIIQVKDYKELSQMNQDFLTRLRSRVNKKWIEGGNIICIGTTSSEDAEPALSRPEIQILQADITDCEKRTIFVPPDRREEQDVAFEYDEKARIRRVNVRHIEDMVLKLAEGTNQLALSIDIEKNVDSAAVYSADLEDAVWPYAKVHRVATTILGLEITSSSIDGSVFSEALQILSASDEAKFAWGAVEMKEEESEIEITLGDVDYSAQKRAKDKIKDIRSRATQHEKKLLSGVVLPENIRTTFADIRAPKETVEALKTLTSLSLVRPEAFSYGVLATDKIPGLLLYGPPGTGKTLLAKAVAKESGATMLEVSAADMNDMFVGEGEKNVKALFSLAKKLSPCVVFIDEADALFSARGDSGSRRTTHREMINQFLREWDGMNDSSAFIMVATNRPFDLDEAVLRRLPRRLLIDLPVEKDREAILKIHLKDEVLDESVNLAKLAKNTPFYSGSDLKNLSVAAALACIREENEIAAQHTGEGPYEYPEKRTLTKKHFDKAMEEISASISEDMSTLTAIRKFDEKYGDRKGRRKKGPGLGFGGTKVEEKDSEAARVRKMEL